MSTPNLPRVVVSPYCPDGGCSFSSWLLLQGVCGFTGLVTGALGGMLSHTMYIVFVLPLMLGMAVGWAGRLVIQFLKVRSAYLAMVAGLLGGGCAVAAMHYLTYQEFHKSLVGKLSAEEFLNRQQLARNYEELRKNPPGNEAVQEYLDHLGKDSALLSALRVDSLAGFFRHRAEQGLMTARRDGRDRGFNLGYVGSYVYWALELAILIGIAIGMMRDAAFMPYCEVCREWKKWKMLGAVDEGPRAVEALEAGDLNSLQTLHPRSAVGEYNLSVCLCPTCGFEMPVELKLERRTFDADGNPSDSGLTMLTYPGDSLLVLAQMFANPK